MLYEKAIHKSVKESLFTADLWVKGEPHNFHELVFWKRNIPAAATLKSLWNLGPVQTPYFSCAEPHWISSTLERHWRDIWFRRCTVCRT